MTAHITPVHTLDLSQAKWWWKERSNDGGGFDGAASELQRPRTSDGVSEEGTPVLAKPDRNAIQESWFAATRFPSEVHVELLAREAIPHPYVAFNEHEVQCELLPLCSPTSLSDSC